MSSMLNEAKFWEVIKYLVGLENKASFEDICKDLSITKRQLNSFVNFLKEVDYQYDIEKQEDAQFLNPASEQPKINIEFNLYEWLQFQAHFPSLAACKEKPYHSEIKKKLAKAENEFQKHELFEPANALEQILESYKPALTTHSSPVSSDIIAFVEESILEGNLLNLKYAEKSFVISPRKIVYLDGELNLVAEDINDKCLINISLSQVSNLFEDDSAWNHIYSEIEVNDFISGIRAISENEVRLVLKVVGRDHFDRSIPHQHLGSPCMFTNPEGDFIWAASIEPNTAIFEWLNELGRDVEILDPTDFKKEYLSYCEHKLKKLA